MQNSKGAVSIQQKKAVNKGYLLNLRRSQLSSIFAQPVTVEQILEALSQVQNGKAPGIDNIFPNFLKNLGPKAIRWLAKFFTHIYETGKLPRLWKKSKIIVFLKPNKQPNLPENYRPISLLSCSYKLFERVILARIADVIDANIPKEQAGFRKNRSCCDQVLALTNYIELGFEREMKTGVVFLDLTAAYDTVWKRGVMFKLSKIIPCRTTLTLFMNMLSDRSFQVEMNGSLAGKEL